MRHEKRGLMRLIQTTLERLLGKKGWKEEEMRDLVTGKWHGPDMNSAFKEDKPSHRGAWDPFSNTRERCASDSLRGLIFKIAYYFTVRPVPRGREKEGYYPSSCQANRRKIIAFQL